MKVLVVEAAPKAVQSLQSILEGPGGQFEPTYVDSLGKALALLHFQNPERESFETVLINLNLPDSQGLDTFLQLLAQAPEVPIVVLSPQADPGLAREAIREGAQDCLFQEEINANNLSRSLLYAVERHHTWISLQRLCLTDDLTGLLNRRGFMSMAQHQIKIARREDWKMLLLFADLDGLKKINDSYGHPQGDEALRRVADILRETFRTSDLISRLGGDEFIVLAQNVSSNGIEPITGRLQEKIDQYNARLSCYQLSLSWGFALYDPKRQASLEDVIVEADRALYHNKRKRYRQGAST